MTFDDMSHYNADSLCVRDKLNNSKLYCVLSLSKSLLSIIISPPCEKWPLNIQTVFVLKSTRSLIEKNSFGYAHENKRLSYYSI